MRKLKNKYYIIIAIIAIVVIAAVIITVVVSKSKDNDEEDNVSVLAENEYEGDTSPVSMSDDVEVSFEDMSDDLASEFEAHDVETTVTSAFKAETTTVYNNNQSANQNQNNKVSAQEYVELTTVKTHQAAQKNDTVLSAIDAFFKGKYYFDGNMIQDGSSSPFEIAMNGEDFVVYSEMESIDIGILSLEGKMYLLNPDEKKYIHLSKSLQDTLDIDLDSLKFEFVETTFDGYSPSSVVEGLYNSEPAVCYTYENGESHLEFVVVNEEIKQITQYDQKGNAKSVLQADEFSVEFSEDEISLNGYKKTNMISFMKDMI